MMLLIMLSLQNLQSKRRNKAPNPLLLFLEWLLNLVSRPLDASSLAAWATARTSETFAIFKYESTFQAPGRMYDKPFSFVLHRTCNMMEMFVDLFFPDSNMLGNVNGIHRIIT